MSDSGSCGQPRDIGILTGMPLKQKHIDELITIHRRIAGETLSNEHAWDMARRLVNLYALVYRQQSNQPNHEKIKAGNTKSNQPRK